MDVAPKHKRGAEPFDAVLMLAGPATVKADHKVYSPVVEKGELAIEARGHVDFDDEDSKDGEQIHVYELEYGVTDYWLTSIFGEFREAPSGSFKYTATAWENIFEILTEENHGIGAGLYLEFKDAHRVGLANEFEFKLLLEKRIWRLVNTLNANFEQPVGSRAEESLEFEYAWRTMARITENLYAGFEAFGEIGEVNDAPSLGDQAHQLGPIVAGKFKVPGIGEFEYITGWLFGLTDESPDGAFKWQLEYELPF